MMALPYFHARPEYARTSDWKALRSTDARKYGRIRGQGILIKKDRADPSRAGLARTLVRLGLTGHAGFAWGCTG